MFLEHNYAVLSSATFDVLQWQSWVVATETHSLEGLKYSGKSELAPGFDHSGSFSLWCWGEWDAGKRVCRGVSGRQVNWEERTAWKSGIVLLQLCPFHSGSFQFLIVILMNALKEHSDNHFSDCCTVQLDAKVCIFLLFLGRCKSLVQKCSSLIEDMKFYFSDSVWVINLYVWASVSWNLPFKAIVFSFQPPSRHPMQLHLILASWKPWAHHFCF